MRNAGKLLLLLLDDLLVDLGRGGRAGRDDSWVLVFFRLSDSGRVLGDGCVKGRDMD